MVVRRVEPFHDVKHSSEDQDDNIRCVDAGSRAHIAVDLEQTITEVEDSVDSSVVNSEGVEEQLESHPINVQRVRRKQDLLVLE